MSCKMFPAVDKAGKLSVGSYHPDPEKCRTQEAIAPIQAGSVCGREGRIGEIKREEGKKCMEMIPKVTRQLHNLRYYANFGD